MNDIISVKYEEMENAMNLLKKYNSEFFDSSDFSSAMGMLYSACSELEEIFGDSSLGIRDAMKGLKEATKEVADNYKDVFDYMSNSIKEFSDNMNDEQFKLIVELDELFAKFPNYTREY